MENQTQPSEQNELAVVKFAGSSITWTVECDDGLREYRATVSGIEFHIIHSIDGARHNFGLTANRRGADGSYGLNLANGGYGIAWCGTRRRCIQRAESIAREQGAL